MIHNVHSGDVTDDELKTIKSLIYQDILSTSILSMVSDSRYIISNLNQFFKRLQQPFSFIVVVRFLNIRVNSRLNTTPVTHLDEEVCHHAL